MDVDLSRPFISFPDQSASFVHGVEYGRLLQKMEQGDDFVMNNGFPIRIENRELIIDTCNKLGYIPTFGTEHFGEWIDFIGLKKKSTDN